MLSQPWRRVSPRQPNQSPTTPTWAHLQPWSGSATPPLPLLWSSSTPLSKWSPLPPPPPKSFPDLRPRCRALTATTAAPRLPGLKVSSCISTSVATTSPSPPTLRRRRPGSSPPPASSESTSQWTGILSPSAIRSWSHTKCSSRSFKLKVRNSSSSGTQALLPLKTRITDCGCMRLVRNSHSAELLITNCVSVCL